MKGLVFTTFIDYVEEHHGYKVIDEAFNSLDLSSQGIYSALGYYDFAEMVALLEFFSETLGADPDDMVYSYGKHLFSKLFDAHPNIVQEYQSAPELLNYIEHHIHYEVQKLYPDAKLPTIDVKISNDERTIDLAYQSHRPLAWLFRGLVEGCLAHFEQLSAYKIIPQMTETKTSMNLKLVLNETS